MQKLVKQVSAFSVTWLVKLTLLTPCSFCPFRSSITRLSVDDKALRTKEVSSQERDLLLHKTSIPETIPEKKDVKSFIITTPTEGKESTINNVTAMGSRVL